jgi:hypothetical protein
MDMQEDIEKAFLAAILKRINEAKIECEKKEKSRTEVINVSDFDAKKAYEIAEQRIMAKSGILEKILKKAKEGKMITKFPVEKLSSNQCTILTNKGFTLQTVCNFTKKVPEGSEVQPQGKDYFFVYWNYSKK